MGCCTLRGTTQSPLLRHLYATRINNSQPSNEVPPTGPTSHLPGTCYIFCQLHPSPAIRNPQYPSLEPPEKHIMGIPGLNRSMNPHLPHLHSHTEHFAGTPICSNPSLLSAQIGRRQLWRRVHPRTRAGGGARRRQVVERPRRKRWEGPE